MLADKDGVIDCAEQIRLTEMRASEAPSLIIIGLCQLVMRRYTFYEVRRTFTCM